MITAKTITKVTQERQITLTDVELCDLLRKYFDLDPSAEIDFDIRQGSYLAGCSITESTTTIEEKDNGEG